MRKHFTLLALPCALTALALLPATTAAADGSVLTYGSAGGTAVSVGDVLTAPLTSGSTATLYNSSSGTTGITCTDSQLTATVTANPSAPGTAGESATAQTFSNCTSNVFGVTAVDSVSVDNMPYTTTVASGGALTVTPASGSEIQTTVVLGTLLGSVTCVYQAGPLTGTSSNTGNTIAFSNQAFSLTSGSGLCPSSGYFSATYGPVTDSSVSGSPAVYTN
jgi:hypothetical protein